MGVTTGWEIIPATRPPAIPADPPPVLSGDQKRLLGHINGLSYGFFQAQGGERSPRSPDCFVIFVYKGRFGKTKKRFVPVWRLNPLEERPLMAVTCPHRGWDTKSGQVICSDGQQGDDGLVAYLPIDEFVLTRRVEPDQIEAMLEKARYYTRG